MKWVRSGEPGLAIDFEQLPFEHPLYIMYSSGTTGLPKCMVQSAGGILVASHVVGNDMRRMVDDPGERAAIDASLQDIYSALSVAPAAVTAKTALELLGHRAGPPRLPLVPADDAETAVIRQALERHGLLAAAPNT